MKPDELSVCASVGFHDKKMDSVLIGWVKDKGVSKLLLHNTQQGVLQGISFLLRRGYLGYGKEICQARKDILFKTNK